MEYNWKFDFSKENSLKNKIKNILGKYILNVKISLVGGNIEFPIQGNEVNITLYPSAIDLHSKICNQSFEEIFSRVVEEEIVHSLISYPETLQLHYLEGFGEIYNSIKDSKKWELVEEYLK